MIIGVLLPACACVHLAAPAPQVAALPLARPAMAHPPVRPPGVRPSAPDPAIPTVLALARSLVGARRFEVKGRRFRGDCSNFVRAVFSTLDLDLFAVPHPPPHANGVRLIHAWVARYGVNYRARVPKPGDVVYFDNTYDRNHDGRLDDRLTHVGLVDEVEPDGTFYVIHDASHGVEREPMNLLHPHDRLDAAGREINAFLRRRTGHDRPGTPRLMGELFAGFGTVHRPAKPPPARLDLVPPAPDGDDLPPPPVPES